MKQDLDLKGEPIGNPGRNLQYGYGQTFPIRQSYISDSLNPNSKLQNYLNFAVVGIIVVFLDLQSGKQASHLSVFVLSSSMNLLPVQGPQTVELSG